MKNSITHTNLHEMETPAFDFEAITEEKFNELVEIASEKKLNAKEFNELAWKMHG